MANHVSFSVQFREINDAAKACWKEMTDRLVAEQYEYWFGDLFVDGKEGSPTSEDVRQYSWTTENIGPKWCYINDFDEDSFNGYSAWSAPEEGLVKILEELEQHDPNIITSITYEDEMPNFVGWSLYVGSELEDGCEDDSEEIRDAVFHNNDHLKQQWDEDEDYWKTNEDGDLTEEAEQAQEEYWEAQYEYISEWQFSEIEEALKYYTQREEEKE